MPSKKKAKEVMLDKLIVKKDRGAILIRFTDSYYRRQHELLNRLTDEAVRISLGIGMWDIIKKETHTKANYKLVAEFLREVADSLEKGNTTCYKNRMGRFKKKEVLELLQKDGDEKRIAKSIKSSLIHLRP